jgi:hypothetical protein
LILLLAKAYIYRYRRYGIVIEYFIERGHVIYEIKRLVWGLPAANRKARARDKTKGGDERIKKGRLRFCPSIVRTFTCKTIPPRYYLPRPAAIGGAI